jgi:tRNA U34 5-carboxymethylaminomethyl modifying GTPase MnmE/TrmE
MKVYKRFNLFKISCTKDELISINNLIKSQTDFQGDLMLESLSSRQFDELNNSRMKLIEMHVEINSALNQTKS